MSRRIATNVFSLRYYDESKNFLSGSSVGNTTDKEITFRTVANCKYIRFVDLTNDLNNEYKIERRKQSNRLQ